MRYEKPVVVALAWALKAIESGNKHIQLVPDRVQAPPAESDGAYEADE